MNKEERKEYMKKWFQKLSRDDRDKRNEQKRNYNKDEKNKEKIRLSHKIWVENNREKANIIARKSYHKNKHRYRGRDSQRKKKLWNSLTKEEKIIRQNMNRERNIVNRLKLIELLGDRCEECGESDYYVLHIGHRYDDGYKDRQKFKKSTTRIVNYYLRNLDEAKKRLILQCDNCNHRQRMKIVYDLSKKVFDI